MLTIHQILGLNYHIIWSYVMLLLFFAYCMGYAISILYKTQPMDRTMKMLNYIDREYFKKAA